MTAFQQRIYDFLKTQPNRYASTWIIAQRAFPEKWKKAAARGALVGHITRAAYTTDQLEHHPSPTYPGCASVAIPMKHP